LCRDTLPCFTDGAAGGAGKLRRSAGDLIFIRTAVTTLVFPAPARCRRTKSHPVLFRDDLPVLDVYQPADARPAPGIAGAGRGNHSVGCRTDEEDGEP